MDMRKLLKDTTVGWTAIAIGLGAAATPAWMATTAASAGTTLALGAATVIYGAWSVIARTGGGDHWPLFVVGLALALSPWLEGFTGERATWIAWIAGLALLVIGRVHTRTVALLAAHMTSPTAPHPSTAPNGQS
jgi:hypothetical protein